MATFRRDIVGPILGIYSYFHRAMKRRIGPIPDPSHKPVLDWIDVNVIHMTREVALIADGVLPIAALPNAALGVRGTALRYPFASRNAA